MNTEPEAYDVDDVGGGGCGDESCCGPSRYSVFLPVRGWVWHFEVYTQAERMARLCKRWGVK